MIDHFEKYARAQQEGRKAKITAALAMSLIGMFVGVALAAIAISAVLNYVQPI